MSSCLKKRHCGLSGERNEGSQQGSSTEDTVPIARPSDHVGSSTGTGLSSVILAIEKTETEDLGSVKSRG